MSKKHLDQSKFYKNSFFKNFDNLHLFTSIPGLKIILSNLILEIFF